MTTLSDTKTFQTRNVLLVAFSHFLHDVYSSFLSPLLPLLIAKLGISYTMAGLLPAAQRVPSLLNPWLGMLADRIQVRYFTIFAPAVTALCMSLLGMAPSYSVVFLLLLLSGVSSACYHVPSPVLVRKVSGERVGKGMSFFMLGGELARTLGPLTIVGGISLWGLEHTYWLVLPGFLASAFLYITFKNLPLQQGVQNVPATGLIQTIRASQTLFLSLSGIILCIGGLKSAMFAFLPTYLTEQGHSLTIAGISMSVLEGGGVAGVLTAGILSDRVGRKMVLLVVSIATPLLTWVFLRDPGAFTLPVLGMLGFFLFASGPVMLAAVQDVKSDRPAYLNGIYMMINFAVGSGMSIIVGMLNDWLGLQTTYWIASLFFLGTIPCLYFLPGAQPDWYGASPE